MRCLWFVLGLAGCRQPGPAVAPSPAAFEPPHDEVGPVSGDGKPFVSQTSDGSDLPEATVAKLFDQTTTFALEIRRGSAITKTACSVTDVVYMQENKVRSSRVHCDVKGPMNGILFADASSFWWIDEAHYVAGSGVPDAKTRAFARTPRAAGGDDERQGYRVKKNAAGDAWCYEDTLEEDGTRTLCFAGGLLVEGTATDAKGAEVEFRLAR